MPNHMITLAAASALALSACGGTSTPPQMMPPPGGGAAFTALDNERRAIEADRFAATPIGISEVPMTGSATYSGVVTYDYFAPRGANPDYDGVFSIAGRMNMGVNFEGAFDDMAEPVTTASATGFVTDTGVAMVGTLDKVADSSIPFDANNGFPIRVDIAGTLTPEGGAGIDFESTISGFPGGTGLGFIAGAAQGTATRGGAPFANLEGDFSLARNP